MTVLRWGMVQVLFFVPDGKVKAMSTVSRQVHHADEVGGRKEGHGRG